MTEQTGPNLPRASLAHVLPGRIRLQFAGHRGDAAFFSRLAQGLSDAPEIRAVRANPSAASLLIIHGADGVEEIARLARERGLFQLVAPPPEAVPVTRSAAVARPVRLRIPPLRLAAAGFVGLGVVQTARGHFHGNSAESLWNAYMALALRRQPLVAAGLAGLGLYQLFLGRALGSGMSLFLYALVARYLARGGQAVD